MVEANYTIMAGPEIWWVLLGERKFAYDTREQAMAAAVAAAHSTGQKGHDAKVMVASASGDYRPIWQFGDDPSVIPG